MRMYVNRSANTLLAGGIIAYPTEGIYGLGCLPDDSDAVVRLLGIKQRKPGKGLILIVSDIAYLDGWVAREDRRRLPQPDPVRPVTWIVRPAPQVPAIVRGDNDGLAVRITTNPVAAAICDEVQVPVISTSANVEGRPAARNRFVLRRQFGSLVDYIVPGDCGPVSGASEIRSLSSGKIIRQRSA